MRTAGQLHCDQDTPPGRVERYRDRATEQVPLQRRRRPPCTRPEVPQAAVRDRLESVKRPINAG
jgi:hypothetical protein